MSAPIAVNDTATVLRDQIVTIDLAANDTPAGGTAGFVYSILAGPSNGNLFSFDSALGTVQYQPGMGFTGSDSFTYTLTNTGDSSSSTATVTITVTAPPSNVCIKAWYNGQEVYLGVIPNALVFDGFSFVRPQDAKFVTIVESVTVGPEVVPTPWPETNTIHQASLTWTNQWLCSVIEVTTIPTADADIVAIVDPNNGACVCGVSCMGDDLQYVTVEPDPYVVDPPPFVPPETPGLPPGMISPASLGADPMPAEPTDVIIARPNGHTIRAHVLTSIGGPPIGLIISGIT